MAPKTTRKGGTNASKEGDKLNSKAETDTEAIATTQADSDNLSMNNTSGYNIKRRREAPNEASDAFLASATGVTAKTSAGAGGEDASTSGVPSNVKSTNPATSYAAKSQVAAVAETARPIAMELYGDGDAGGKVGGGTGAMHVPPTTLPHGLDTIPAEPGAADVNVTYTSLISGMARANQSNVIKEENYYLLHWLYRIRRVGCARGLRIGFLQPDFLWSIYRPMMRSKKLWRTDGDIRVAVNLWCTNRAAAEERYGHVSDWDVSSVTDMSKLFREQEAFNDDISRWDMSNVTNMSFMFDRADSFNQAVEDWDVSNVTNMNDMFFHAEAFNQTVEDWDVSTVTDMSHMFNYATSFNQPVGDWDVSSVTNMNHMFGSARSFNQAVGDWDVSSVTDMCCMFGSARSFNQAVGDWDVSNVNGMVCMFYGASEFNQDLTRWGIRSVRDITAGMFWNALAMEVNNKPACFR